MPSATDSDSINYSRVCRAATNICDVAESCAAGSCPINGFAPDTVVCRAATTQCDANETCTGISDVCPPNVYQPLGTFCGNPPVGTCDQQDTCDGNNNCIDRYGSCNDGYSCTTDICDPSPPHNCQFTPDDQVCSDGVQCTRDVCVASTASLQTLYGVPPNASGCVNQADVNLCDTCNCAPASECNPTSESQWSDGCVHHFVSAAGSILPSTDEPIAACNSS